MAKILVIDDESQVREVLRKFLEKAGHEVYGIEDGIDAKKTIRGNRPDLIICDVMMPKLDGSALIYNLKSEEEFRGIPVILVSALGEERKYLGEDVGAEYYMGKPFDMPLLLERVNELTSTRIISVKEPRIPMKESHHRRHEPSERKHNTTMAAVFGIAGLMMLLALYIVNSFWMQDGTIAGSSGVTMNIDVLSDTIFVFIMPFGLAFLVYQSVIVMQIFKKQHGADRLVVRDSRKPL